MQQRRFFAHDIKWCDCFHITQTNRNPPSWWYLNVETSLKGIFSSCHCQRRQERSSSNLSSTTVWSSSAIGPLRNVGEREASFSRIYCNIFKTEVSEKASLNSSLCDLPYKSYALAHEPGRVSDTAKALLESPISRLSPSDRRRLRACCYQLIATTTTRSRNTRLSPYPLSAAALFQSRP